MSRLIDADELSWKLAEYKFAISPITEEQKSEMRIPLQMLMEFEHMVSEQPTVDAVKHGEWQIEEMNTYDLAYGCTGYEPRYRCSCCDMITESYLRTEEPIMPEDASFPDFCPNCGAKMSNG